MLEDVRRAGEHVNQKKAHPKYMFGEPKSEHVNQKKAQLKYQIACYVDSRLFLLRYSFVLSEF